MGLPSAAAALLNGPNSDANDTVGATVGAWAQTTSTYWLPGYHWVALPSAQLFALGHHTQATLDAPRAAKMLWTCAQAALKFAGVVTVAARAGSSMPGANSSMTGEPNAFSAVARAAIALSLPPLRMPGV